MNLLLQLEISHFIYNLFDILELWKAYINRFKIFFINTFLFI